MADTLADVSLEWALTHVERFGDTDVFPNLFEFDAIRAGWSTVRPELCARDLTDHKPTAVNRILVPKPDAGFRVAVQLDPIDSLMYTAAVYEAASRIEDNRVRAELNIACSYRVIPTPDGSFFQASDGAKQYHEKSRELASADGVKAVLVADIADFYNQVYTHRVQSALESSGVSKQRADNVEAFLLKLSAKQSRGIPVGPAASIVLAEACLDDVDKMLLSRGLKHTRYVDDFRIFCPSRKQALNALHDLSEYLYTAHRLTLQGAKTRVIPIEEFTRQELQDPEEQEENQKKQKIQELIKEIARSAGYGGFTGGLSDSQMNEAVRDNLLDLFEACVSTKPLRIGLARYLLRRARDLRTRNIYPVLFNNLEALAPVFREVAYYINKTLSAEHASKWGPILIRFLTASDTGEIPYVRLWGLWLLQELPELSTYDEAIALAQTSQGKLGLRPCAMIAKAYNQIGWVREYKERWKNLPPWDRRSVIWAASALPATERRVWLDFVKDDGDLLDRLTAQALPHT